MTGRQLARLLINKHSERSWRDISRTDYFGVIPAGTLAMIANSNGQYVPAKWAGWLGVGKPSTRKHCTARRLADMSRTELLFALANRVEMA
jgi:hypothetical protein